MTQDLVPISRRVLGRAGGGLLGKRRRLDRRLCGASYAANLSHDQLQQLSDAVGAERLLLVLCSAFRGRKEGYASLTVKKTPKVALSRCEWGKDDYSLKVENLPKAPPNRGQQDLLGGKAGA